jgi:hypothetical protein
MVNMHFPAAFLERYSLDRKAEFLLANAVTLSDYVEARRAVHEFGLDPDSILARFGE